MNYFENQRYNQKPQHVYDLALGQSDTLLVLVHGGGWIRGDKKAGNFDGGECLKYVSARYGLNVASVNYTLATDTLATAPITKYSPSRNRPTHNVMTAAKVIAERIGSTRTVLLGTSAGANIAALTYEFYPGVIDGFIGFYGAYDLRIDFDFSPQVLGMIDTYTRGDNRKKVGASPIFRRFPSDFLLYHGSNDIQIKAYQSAVMHYEHGGEFHLIDGKNHGFKPFGTKDRPSPWIERIIRYCYGG